MSESELDVEALVAALAAQRRGRNLSWRKVAKEASVSPSTLTRMQQGKRPDVDTLSALLKWLGMPTETFVRTSTSTRKRSTPHPLAITSTLLRGKKQMSPQAIEALEELLSAAFKFAKEIE